MAAAVRETREETGIALDPEALRLAVSVHQRNPGGHARIGFAFEPGTWSGEPANTEPHKHSELVWADPAARHRRLYRRRDRRRRARRHVHPQRLVTADGASRQLAALWPQFGLLIETPRLQLRLPREDELPALTRAARDIAGPAGPRLQMPWMYEPSPAMERQLLQRHWRALAHWKPGSWHLPLAVFLAGEPAGMQDLWAEDFAVRRSVASGSWITRARQRRGYGTEARAAVLELAFGRLNAAEALTDYVEGNHASERVSRKLGYSPNGQRAVNRDGTGRVTEYQLRLDRLAWEASTRHDHVSITGLGPCLPMLGLAAPDDPAPDARPPGHHGGQEPAPHSLRRQRDQRADGQHVHPPLGPRARLADRPGAASAPRMLAPGRRARRTRRDPRPGRDPRGPGGNRPGRHPRPWTRCSAPGRGGPAIRSVPRCTGAGIAGLAVGAVRAAEAGPVARSGTSPAAATAASPRPGR